MYCVLFCVVGLCCCFVSPSCFHSPTSQMCTPASNHQITTPVPDLPSTIPLQIVLCLLSVGCCFWVELWQSSGWTLLACICYCLVYWWFMDLSLVITHLLNFITCLVTQQLTFLNLFLKGNQHHLAILEHPKYFHLVIWDFWICFLSSEFLTFPNTNLPLPPLPLPHCSQPQLRNASAWPQLLRNGSRKKQMVSFLKTAWPVGYMTMRIKESSGGQVLVCLLVCLFLLNFITLVVSSLLLFCLCYFFLLCAQGQ